MVRKSSNRGVRGYARQDKVWVHGPGDEPWEVYTVTEDSAVYGTDGVLASREGCC